MASAPAGDGRTRLVVLGAGPGGYAAAFLGADLGMDVTLVDAEPYPGGVCLYRGCIPSKALLRVARVMREAEAAERWGVKFGRPEVDLAGLRRWKDGVVSDLARGLGALGRQRRVRYVRGHGRFVDAHTLHVGLDGELSEIGFDYALVATGSTPAVPEALRVDSPRVMDSTAALALRDVPETLLVVGGGYVGLELGTVYAALGSRVTVAEMTSGLLPGADRDLVEPLAKRLRGEFAEVLLNTSVAAMRDADDRVEVELSGADVGPAERAFDRVLVATGRRPNSAQLGLERTGVRVDARGFIVTDAQRRTSEPSIFAAGDVAGEPMLAHKAAHEARAAVEAIAGRAVEFAPQAIPAVVFTDPEVAWCGLTETEAKRRRIDVEVATFPWLASGRAATLGRGDGLTKLILEPDTERLLGVGIVGVDAGELIGEAVLAVEMGTTATDLRLTVHAHPTLAETMMEAAEVFFGQSSHYLGPLGRGNRAVTGPAS